MRAGVSVRDLYRSLQVPEVWRLHDGAVSIDQIDASGNDVAAESSRFLHVRPDDVTRWVLHGKSGNRDAWKSDSPNGCKPS
jgi:hypothetical protein